MLLVKLTCTLTHIYRHMLVALYLTGVLNTCNTMHIYIYIYEAFSSPTRYIELAVNGWSANMEIVVAVKDRS